MSAEMNVPLTDQGNDPGETGNTFETRTLGNQDFLHVLFEGAGKGSCPILVQFKGDPTSVPASAWCGTPWRGPGTVWTEDHNNYFSLATFLPNNAGEYRRTKATFAGLHALMLDDVGTKVPMERMSLAPTWVIETSPGNHQFGFVLREPLTDGPLADRLMKAVIAAGLCDPGANGPSSRLARLPVASNGKLTPAFSCRLLTWAPEVQYSVEELVAGMNLEMVPVGRPKRRHGGSAHASQKFGNQIWTPRPAENSVLVALRDLGLYKSALTNGGHDMTCPWVKEHTDEQDGGTAYFEPDNLWPSGGFKCQHGHCSKRHIRDLLDFLGIDINTAHMKATIRAIPGEMDKVVDAAEWELSQQKGFYQRGGLIVTVVTDPGTQDTQVQEITLAALPRALSVAAIWERYDARAEGWVRTDPPPRYAAALHASTNYSHLCVLNGITRQPYLRHDGTLATNAGYDPNCGMVGVFHAREFSVPDDPTPEEAREALRLLEDLLAEFSFASDVDRAAALSAILSASIRPSLRLAPMFHVQAHMPGSGKSYLCELVTAFATPQRGVPAAFPHNNEECGKLLLAALLQAPAVIEFDNLTSDLVAHLTLCTALTSEFIKGRILGFSKTATVTTRTLFLSSGNNVGPVKDMSRRCITICLSPQSEEPASRNFLRPDLIQEVINQRGRYVSAALTIVRAWIVAGRPKTQCKAVAGFGDWSDLCRQPLLWLGTADPASSIFRAISEDPDRETLGRLLVAWQSAFKKNPVLVRDAAEMAENILGQQPELKEVLVDISRGQGEINHKSAGWWLKSHAGCIVDGRRIVAVGSGGSGTRWYVEELQKVFPVSSVSNVPSDKSVREDQPEQPPTDPDDQV